jgi:hypothetical protein
MSFNRPELLIGGSLALVSFLLLAHDGLYEKMRGR